MINQISALYRSTTPKWDSISDLSSDLGWTEITNTTTKAYLAKQGVSPKYIDEIVEAATRVNYGQVRSAASSQKNQLILNISVSERGFHSCFGRGVFFGGYRSKRNCRRKFPNL